MDFDYRFDYHITDITGSKRNFLPIMDKQNTLYIFALQVVLLVKQVVLLFFWLPMQEKLFRLNKNAYHITPEEYDGSV